jgi:predicted small secreted protein
MKTVTSILVIVAAVLAGGCNTPPGVGKDTGAQQIAVMLPVLAHMVAEADKTGDLVRFVDLRSPEIERLKDLCGPRFQIHRADESERSTGILRLKGSNREGVHLVAEVMRVRGRGAEVSGAYVHVGSFASFRFKLRYTDGAWRISSCEFYGAS